MRVTINTQPKADEEDIFKAGTLVCSGDVYVLVHHDNADETFSGTSLTETDDWNAGEYHQQWDKACFVKFIGNVLLEQE